MTPSVDVSARILTAKLLSCEPFVYVRYGDADIPWMLGQDVPAGETCDGERTREGLGTELRRAWRTLCGLPHFLCGDLCTMDLPAESWIQDEFRRMCEPYSLKFLHSEALLIHRLSAPLKEFYRILRRDTRRKVLLGPHRVSPAANLLRSDFVPIHLTCANEPQEIAGAIDRLNATCKDWDVLMMVGGRASKIIGAKMAAQYPTRTVIELGSALDPLFVGQTRTSQVQMHEARAFFSELWWEL